jgi:nitrite reductase (NADH) small subunit
MSLWIRVCRTDDILENGGSCVKVGGEQIAIFNFDDGSRWYAVENRCPHKGQEVISQGLTGEDLEGPKVACPLHKNCFSLETGKHLGDNKAWQLKTYDLRVEDNEIFIKIDREHERYDA